MDFLATPMRRRILFAALYLSEGAPIGFLWLALPTQLRAAGIPLEHITALTAALVIPWTFKFAWAPLVDVLRTSRWTLKHWVLTAQTLMGMTLLPLIWIDPLSNLPSLSALLLIHATAAATQDVAIDALCISVTDVAERGRLNGWMQAGMLAGRAAMGGGALLLSSYMGDAAVVAILVSITTFSGVLLLGSKLPLPTTAQFDADDAGCLTANVSRLTESTSRSVHTEVELRQRIRSVAGNLTTVVRDRTTWIGLLFALTGPAAFKAFEVVIGPFLIDRNYTEEEVGAFTAFVMIGAMVLGSIVGGQLADRFSRKVFVAMSLLFIVGTLSSLAVSDFLAGKAAGIHLPVLIAMTAFGIGVFTVATYALYMDLTTPSIAATQFSAFMGATNGCESWSTFAMGKLVTAHGYATGILVLCGVSVVSLPLLRWLQRDSNDTTGIVQ